MHDEVEGNIEIKGKMKLFPNGKVVTFVSVLCYSCDQEFRVREYGKRNCPKAN